MITRILVALIDELDKVILVHHADKPGEHVRVNQRLNGAATAVVLVVIVGDIEEVERGEAEAANEVRLGERALLLPGGLVLELLLVGFGGHVNDQDRSQGLAKLMLSLIGHTSPTLSKTVSENVDYPGPGVATNMAGIEKS